MNAHAQPSPDGTYVVRVRPSIAGSTAHVAAEIADYQASLDRFLDGRVPEAVFLENRLRHGIYGQRQDGVHMVRSKLPLGLLSPEQFDAFADLTETHGHGIAHLTTRQDIQIHFVRLPDSPAVMAALDRAAMTSREACGNVVRNVCASPVAGVLPGEAFDVTPHAMAAARFLLRIPDGQSLGRKFKITFAGSDDPRFDLGALHDVGFVAREIDGQRGFHVRVGGGLGAVAHEAVTFTDFLPEAELLPFLRAVIKVFNDHGEKHKRARARMKFLVAGWGLDRFRDEVVAVRAGFEDDPAWTSFLDTQDAWTDHPVHGPGPIARPTPRTADDATWLRTNVFDQPQPGYATVQVRVPTGDLTPTTLRGVASLLREHTGDTARIGPDQSLWIRWVPTDRLWTLRDGLTALGLGGARAGGLGDTVTCPGADTCKLGITSPRRLAAHLQPTLDRLADDPRLERLRIHVSGCPNSCAQHHIADIGLFGAAKTVDGVTAPHFILMLGGLAGGRSADPSASGEGFGTPVLKLPAKRVDVAIERLAAAWLEEAEEGEAFGTYARRMGRQRFKALLTDLTDLPSPADAPDLYVEHGLEDTPFKVVRGTGECAGAVVSQADLLMMEADRHADDAVQALEDGADPTAVRDTTARAFAAAARALLSTQGLTDVADDGLLDAYQRHIYDAGVLYEGVGHYLLQAFTEDDDALVGDRLRRRVAEAGLFAEEAHSVVGRLLNPAAKGGAA